MELTKVDVMLLTFGASVAMGGPEEPVSVTEIGHRASSLASSQSAKPLHTLDGATHSPCIVHLKSKGSHSI